MRLYRRILPWLALFAGCGDAGPTSQAPPAGPLRCSANDLGPTREAVTAQRVVVVLEETGDARTDMLAADFELRLGALWGVPVEIRRGSETPSEGLRIRVGSAAALREAAGAPASGYALRRVDGTNGSIEILVAGATVADAVHGAYALLEELGVRFFHPRHTLTPKGDRARLPRSLAVARSPWVPRRGIQVHTLHPIEYQPALCQPGEQNLREAKELIDWLVRTGQNYLQWYLLQDVDWASYRPHAQAILDYAHARGVTTTAVVQLWGGASLQKSVVLVEHEKTWQPELEAGLDKIMELPWDGVNLAMGEFFGGNGGSVLEWMNHATAYLAERHPQAQLSVTNHVGSSPDLYVQHEGKSEYYYHLPGLADPRLANDVHTVFFFDLYRPWAAYGHEDFSFHREFLFRESGERSMGYKPESAYWATADVDVPVFLPAYIEARWTDIHQLARDFRDKGLRPPDRHILFTSGYEWGYWLTDYLTARMLWSPDDELGAVLAHFGTAFGSCAEEMTADLAAVTAHQRKYLFDRRLVGYVSGEDQQDDLATLLDIETTPARLPFETVLAMTDAAASAFEGDVVAGLAEASLELEPLVARLRERCLRTEGDALPFCLELRDGVDVVRLRLSHAAALYRAVLALRAKDAAAPSWIEAAIKVRGEAALVIAERETHYRFEAKRLTDPQPGNGTVYPYGYLRQAHTQCFWRRREQQVQHLLTTGAASSPFDAELSTCLE